MTPDEHAKRLGELVANLQSLELLLRVFLQALPTARPIGIPKGKDLWSFAVGEWLPESELTSYDTLGMLIKKFNAEMEARELPQVVTTLVNVRDALAHGRVSAPSPAADMRLLKFSKPSSDGRVQVLFNEQLTKEWFATQVAHVLDAIRKVARVCPDCEGDARAGGAPAT
jgi:hypothetical protein